MSWQWKYPTGSTEPTPETIDPPYNKAWGNPATNEPRTRPTSDLPLHADPDTGKVVHERARAGEALSDDAKNREAARITCRNRGRGRGETLARVLTSGFVWTSLLGPLGDDNPLFPIGADFEVNCRCGMTHAIDGGRLRAALSGQQKARSGRALVIDVRTIERV
ncbi:hypothetical protein ACPCG0_09720 [Propionibacteriaceae bacterium Y1923]